MRISKSKQVAAFVLLLVISGCKGSFQAREFQSTADGVLGGSPNVTTTTLPPNPGSNSIDVPSGMLFSVRDNLFKVKNPVAGEQYQWSYTLSGRNDECIAEASESEYMVFCKLPGLLKVKLTVTEVGGARKNYETADLQVNSQHETGTVKFVIPEGTANDPWNTEEKVITLRVGDKFVVESDDSTRNNHCLHTPGNRPTRHCTIQTPLSKGQSEQFDVIAEYDPFTDSSMTYDHFMNPNARVWVESVAVDGQALYQTSCAGCHGPLATSQVKGNNSWRIQHELFTNPSMSGVVSLTDVEVGAIARELNR